MKCMYIRKLIKYFKMLVLVVIFSFCYYFFFVKGNLDYLWLIFLL